jgi:hypothetical protein
MAALVCLTDLGSAKGAPPSHAGVHRPAGHGVFLMPRLRNSTVPSAPNYGLGHKTITTRTTEISACGLMQFLSPHHHLIDARGRCWR